MWGFLGTYVKTSRYCHIRFVKSNFYVILPLILESKTIPKIFWVFFLPLFYLLSLLIYFTFPMASFPCKRLGFLNSRATLGNNAAWCSVFFYACFCISRFLKMNLARAVGFCWHVTAVRRSRATWKSACLGTSGIYYRHFHKGNSGRKYKSVTFATIK